MDKSEGLSERKEKQKKGKTIDSLMMYLVEFKLYRAVTSRKVLACQFKLDYSKATV